MKRPAVRKNLLSAAFAIAAFTAPNLVRAVMGARCRALVTPRAHSIADFGLPRPWVGRQRDRRARSMLPAPWTSAGRSINLDRYAPIQ
jgi:hypothetical protein